MAYRRSHRVMRALLLRSRANPGTLLRQEFEAAHKALTFTAQLRTEFRRSSALGKTDIDNKVGLVRMHACDACVLQKQHRSLCVWRLAILRSGPIADAPRGVRHLRLGDIFDETVAGRVDILRFQVAHIGLEF